ncbi:MAG TPA: PTS sugar transporter subunit IIA [Firmicutes bacterium]|nr:PTS sugar transporter subunit IIA [Bacillota bacterium]
MVGLLIISHGSFASGLLDAAEMILGEQKQVQAHGLQPQDSPEEFFERIKLRARELDTGKGVLVLADLFGGSPANAAARLFAEELSVDVVTGASLPMLLEALLSREREDLPSLANLCLETTAEATRKLSEIFLSQT